MMKKIKIRIRSNYGSVLFEYEKEDNTIKQTLIEAIKQRADLRGADLRGAYLRGAYLTGAEDKKIKIKKIVVFTGLYKYVVAAIIDSKGSKWIKLGCFTRKLKNWEKDFWNNESEFPNNGCLDSNLRVFAYETAKRWFDIIKEK